MYDEAGEIKGRFIVMELVRGKRLDELYDTVENFKDISAPYYEKITRGLKLLLSIPVPPGTRPGPVGGERMRHTFFKDYEAAVPYESVDKLEEHMNNLATWFNESAPTVRLERELHLVYSDLHLGNFMFTDSGDLYMIDFEHASFLPLSFMHFALHCPSVMSKPVAWHIRDHFKDLPNENFEVMHKISGLMLKSSATLGLTPRKRK
ncbi:hypothetical protein ACRALDRAFT_1059576 [Sodiomyces alcalophilus JCM 7366]|uniref:uncharacterized protein n=1 Tax=Sodiomyces alcalophilus JCM 7366 TaxID=591952 RepID=UPI0039B3DF32